MSYFRFGTSELRPSETRDIIAKKILDVLPISEPFRLATIPSAIIKVYVREEECPYPEIPIWDQVVGRNNNTYQARQDYYFFNMRVGAREFR